ncbi:MAG TPA: o-succinylbenzoate--CoA ligase [Chloroflexota bacterium]|nr:o-succinylbenzoate--CoA ligase [Chloroflexota bacterium]
MSAAAPGAAGPSLPEWLHRRAELSPGRLALVSGDSRWTFAELDRRADAVARHLAGLGVRQGDRVATLLRNGPAPVLVLHALARLGAVLAPLNIRLAPAELAWQLADCAAAWLVYDAAHAVAAKAAAGNGGGTALVAEEALTDGASGAQKVLASDAVERRQVDLAALQSIVYTSGTTGRPKGALLTFGNHWWSAVGSALNLGLQAEDRLLASLPLFHVGGMAILWRSVIYGCSAIVQERFEPIAMNAAIDGEGVTIVSVVAAMLQRMLDERGDRPYPSWLRCVLLGGGPAPQPLLAACAARQLPVVQTYGLTETASQAVTLAPEDALRKLGSAGKPLFPLELQIAVDGREASAGETGEICLRGPSVSPGYLRTASGRADGWLHTGDLGRLDAEGYLYVADRRDDLIISGGENVYPAEVEAVLLEHPAVAEAGVSGVPDPRWGQVPVATVVLRGGAAASEGDLLAFCTSRLARYKVPASVQFRQQLPRTASGKLQRRLLQ